MKWQMNAMDKSIGIVCNQMKFSELTLIDLKKLKLEVETMASFLLVCVQYLDLPQLLLTSLDVMVRCLS